MSYISANVRGDTMWRTEAGERVLSKAEWAVFVHGLFWVCETIDPDPSVEREPGAAVNRETGVGTFDRLTLGQQLVLLAEVTSALRDPLVTLPSTTFTHEAAVYAVMRECLKLIELEISVVTPVITTSRQELLAAVWSESEQMPDVTDTDMRVWIDLFDRLLLRLSWDHGIDIPDDWYALPSEVAMERMRLAGYDPAAYHARPHEPTVEQIEAARTTLKRLVVAHFTTNDEIGSVHPPAG